jgi:hypothetical protein
MDSIDIARMARIRDVRELVRRKLAEEKAALDLLLLAYDLPSWACSLPEVETTDIWFGPIHIQRPRWTDRIVVAVPKWFSIAQTPDQLLTAAIEDQWATETVIPHGVERRAKFEGAIRGKIRAIWKLTSLDRLLTSYLRLIIHALCRAGQALTFVVTQRAWHIRHGAHPPETSGVRSSFLARESCA